MDLLASIADLVLHFDVHLAGMISYFGPWTYVILFLIIVGETGLVIAPFLPGDSLLFACGALASRGLLNLWILLPTLWFASIIGDSINYAFGQHLGVKAFRKDARFLNHTHLEASRDFFRRHGGKSIILARFLPFVRTCAPFVAGISHMHYPTFLFYNVVGGFFWAGGVILAGYFFGQIPAVQENFSLVLVAIVAFSCIPAGIAWIRHGFSAE